MISPIMSSSSNQNFDELQWIINIRQAIEEDDDHLHNRTEIPVSIFSVPRILVSSDPASYTPQEVAIGPYHHPRPELSGMERYKLATAKRAQIQFHGDTNFQDFVDRIIELEPQIRSCYHKSLNIRNETLALMMAIDASFLLEFLQIYAIKEGTLPPSGFSVSTTPLLDSAGLKAARNAILRDMVMLENQIPLFVLRNLLQVQCSSLESADDMLQAMLMGFVEEISPFNTKNMQKPVSVQVSECAHLLDYLYRTIVPKSEEQAEIGRLDHQGRASQLSYIRKLLFKILSRFPRCSILAQPVRNSVFPQGNNQNLERSPSSKNLNKPPLVDEITTPSATELTKSSVRFSATVGTITTVDFDSKTASLHLPIISFDVHTNVLLRNLIVYEASSASGPLVLARYAELMSRILESEEDVRLLREKGIVVNRLKSDAEVANMWKGMSKCIRLTKVPLIDEAIEGVNKYYNSRWRIKYWKKKKLDVLGSWQFLSFLATIVLLLLTGLDAFCQVHDCREH